MVATMSTLANALSSAALTLSVLGAVVAAGIGGAGCDAPPAAPGPTLRQVYGLRPPQRIDAPRTALVLVDFQRELVDGGLAVPGAERAVGRARTLLRWARDTGVTVVHVRQLAARPDSPLFRPGSVGIQPIAELVARGDELEVTKSIAGAFSRTDLDARLRAYGIDTVIVAGFMTHLAVDSTARDAAVLGYKVVVASDATASRALAGAGGTTIGADVVHATALAALADRFADLMTSDELVALPVDGRVIARVEANRHR
jgi:nicotinamidase-related amidase